MRNYIIKNLIFFGVAFIVSVAVLAVVQYRKLDSDYLYHEKDQLKEVNAKFKAELNSTIEHQFLLINFLSKSSYPEVALDFNMEEQFFSIVNELSSKDSQMGIILFTDTGKVKSSYRMNTESLEFASKEILKNIKRAPLILYKGYVGYIQPIIAKEEGRIKGYLAGILPFKAVVNALQLAYYEVTKKFLYIRPMVTLIDPEVLTSSPEIDFYFSNKNPPLFRQTAESFVLIGLMTMAILFVVEIILWGSLKKPVKELLDMISSLSTTKSATYTGKIPRDKIFRKIARFLLTEHGKRVKLERVQREKELNERMSEAASRVAHDIRAPLAALNMGMDLTTELPEQKRVIIRRAVARIQDIANHLLNRSYDLKSAATSRAIHLQEGNQVETHLVSTVVDSLISEKRLQFQNQKEGLQIEANGIVQAYGLFILTNPHQLKRALSNLVDNAVEALEHSGKVTVSIQSLVDNVGINISDNGRGIPSEILNRLGQKGVSHGKQGGKGLGLHYAQEYVRKCGGRLTIQSEVGLGTKIHIYLPKAKTPTWFLSKLTFKEDGEIVIVDDDLLIHDTWKERLESLSREVRIFHLSSIKEFISAKENFDKDAIFLFDYEFLHEDQTGLDIIEKYQLQKSSVLVTSHFEEPSILSRCEMNGVHVLPKGMAGVIPIVVEH